VLTSISKETVAGAGFIKLNMYYTVIFCCVIGTTQNCDKRIDLCLKCKKTKTKYAVSQYTVELCVHKRVTVDQVRTADIVNECITFRDGLQRLPDAFTVGDIMHYLSTC